MYINFAGGDGQYLFSAVSSPLLTGGGGAATTFLGVQREALARSTADVVNSASKGTATPAAAASGGAGSAANTPNIEGAGRKLF